jgi:ABC-type lipoprotein export system ATPase subunit
MDEPMANLDKKGKEVLKKLLKKEKERKLIVLTTHEEGLDEIADEVLAL